VINRKFWPFPLLVLLLVGCSPETISLIAPLGTAQHHVNAGRHLLAYGKPEAALREFARARELDPRFVPAMIGEALAHGLNGDFALAMESLDRANAAADATDAKVAVHIGLMRIYSLGREKIRPDWFNAVESEFAAALANNPRSGEAYFYMGQTHEQAANQAKAAVMYERVIELGQSHVPEAAANLARLRSR
jgi:tetratricopeptide (TPR) repeat protein